MNKKIFIIYGLMLAFCIAIAFAANPVQLYTKPISETYTLQNSFHKTVAQIKADLKFKSCANESQWAKLRCSYMYFCFAAIPLQATSIDNALARECVEISSMSITDSAISLKLSNFLPPPGYLIFTTKFITIVNMTNGGTGGDWTVLKTEISTKYTNTSGVRTSCNATSVLWGNSLSIPACYPAKRVCLDDTLSGFCTNDFPIYVMDKDTPSNGFADELPPNLIDANNFCLDQCPTSEVIAGRCDPAKGDGICDTLQSFTCTDNCKQFALNASNQAPICVLSGQNKICDDSEKSLFYACDDSTKNSGICDRVDTGNCVKTYAPVCAKWNSTATDTLNRVHYIGGQTYPSGCFAEYAGSKACTLDASGNPVMPLSSPNCYVPGNCEPGIVQCYKDDDCRKPLYWNPNICPGFPNKIQIYCQAYQCNYQGTCPATACTYGDDSTCAALKPGNCVGPQAKCGTDNKCYVEGSCTKPPTPQGYNIWGLIGNLFSAFFGYVKTLITA